MSEDTDRSIAELDEAVSLLVKRTDEQDKHIAVVALSTEHSLSEMEKRLAERVDYQDEMLRLMEARIASLERSIAIHQDVVPDLQRRLAKLEAHVALMGDDKPVLS